MKRLCVFLACLVLVGINLAQAQTVRVTGTVTSSEDGMPIPGVSVVVKGTTIGGITNIDGKYEFNVPTDAQTLMFSFVGLKTQEVAIAGRTVIDVVMEPETKELEEVVVTALGVTRQKKALGYAVQEVSGKDLNKVKETNFVNAISGKVAGVQIKPSNTMGGSANIVIRGNSSLLGNNQALFVIDGVPVDNSNTNSSNQTSGWGGYDYGNAAMDVNPEDIESISVLKGAASAALYGSRAANGVVLITTKKGRKQKGIGVTVNSGVQWSKFDVKTMPEHQKEYGGGYGEYFYEYDYNGDGIDEEACPTGDDASWGYKFDPNRMVVQWKNLNPASPDYGKPTPWVAAEHDFKYFFKTGINYTNSIAIDGSNENGTFRLSYANMDEKGLLPNSSIKKNTVGFNGSYNFTKKIKVETNANFVQTKGLGRYGTGYDAGNPMSSFAEWFQTNVDFKDLEENYITPDGRQLGWNYEDPTDPASKPYYWDNPYWLRYKNFENDKRDRIYGYVKLNYEIVSGIVWETRFSNDFYSELQEERWAVNSSVTNGSPYYTKFNRSFAEYTAESFLKFNKTISDFALFGLLGASTRQNKIESTYASTSGGLSIPNLYSISNSISAATVTESDISSGLNAFFANLSVGYKNMVYLDLTGRNDISSTLPKDNRSYFYPSASLSFVLSEISSVKELGFLSFSKIRANWAQVGNSAAPYRIYNAYDVNKPWGSQPLNSVSGDFFNPKLKPERIQNLEFGLEMKFLNDRLGFDIASYTKRSYDQIVPINISRASGLNRMYMNVGEIENKGFEVTLTGKPVVTSDFTWNINVNWFTNKNKVVSLDEQVDNITLFSAWDVSVNATVGEPYGAIKGTNYVFKDGKKVVYSPAEELAHEGTAGMYKKTENDEVLGNINPDWNAGITNTFTYKNFSLSGLIDIQKGGDIYSVNMKYGMSTGLFKETAGLNDKGKPKRDPVASGGGIIYEGVYADGTPNTTYMEANTWGTAYDYEQLPTAHYIYDASFVKLRELSLTYSLPSKFISKTPFTGLEISFVGRNLWIIHKNAPNFDPEASLSSGNNQGIEFGNYPATKTLGFNVRVSF